MPNSDAPLGADLERFYALRNAVRGEDGRMRLMVHGFAPCMAHDPAAKRCMIYEERPQGCQEFPSVPEQIEGTPCSYYFEITDAQGVVTERRGGLDSPYPTPPRFKE